MCSVNSIFCLVPNLPKNRYNIIKYDVNIFNYNNLNTGPKMEEITKNQSSTVPYTDFAGSILVHGFEIPCAVLYADSDKPVRVLIQREVVGLLTGNKKGGFDRYFQPKNLQPFVPEKYKDKPFSETTIHFKYKGKDAQGFEADDLIDICKMYMSARSAGVLLENQMHLAVQSEIIVFAFAKTGINAVVDEVTGFQDVRERFALNKMLEKYIDGEAKKWVKRFPDKFYQLIFKLNGWEYNVENIKNRPGIVGTWTKDIIYHRFPKGILAKLEDKNPLTEKGYRKYKHHQFLTDEIGNVELRDYISNAIFLMASCSNWAEFKTALARATGRPFQGSLFQDYDSSAKK